MAMVIDKPVRLDSVRRPSSPAAPNILARAARSISRSVARMVCGMHGHLILLHFEPDRLSLECALCGYQSEGWDIGHPTVARKPVDTLAHTQVRHGRRRVA